MWLFLILVVLLGVTLIILNDIRFRLQKQPVDFFKLQTPNHVRDQFILNQYLRVSDSQYKRSNSHQCTHWYSTR